MSSVRESLSNCPRQVYRHGRIVAHIVALFSRVLSTDYIISAGNVGFLLDPNPEAPTVHGADVAVNRRESLGSELPSGWFQGAPLVAIEVVSPGNTARDLQKKVKEYLDAGTQEVWLVYPETRTVKMYLTGDHGNPQVLNEEDIVKSLLGQEFSVADMFRV